MATMDEERRDDPQEVDYYRVSLALGTVVLGLITFIGVWFKSQLDTDQLRIETALQIEQTISARQETEQTDIQALQVLTKDLSAGRESNHEAIEMALQKLANQQQDVSSLERQASEDHNWIIIEQSRGRR